MESLIKEVLEILRPLDPMTVSEWADTYRTLDSAASAEPGKWRTSRVPFQREWMDSFTEEGIEEIVLMVASQTGKTEMMLNVMGYLIDREPSPMLFVQPTADMALSVARDRLGPMITSAKPLFDATKPYIRNGNTTTHKAFAGGHLTLVGSNSPSQLASRPIRVALLDEVDRYPASAQEEGDPVQLVKKRTATFANRKVLLSSTPTISGSSRIEIAYDQSDQRKFHVACPSCNEYQELVFKNLQWEHNEDGQIQKSWYMCEENGCVIEEADKSAMLDTGYWKANATPISPKIRGYHLNALYSPFFTWTEVGEEFLLSKKSRETLKTFTNTVLAETFSDLVEEIDSSDLQQRSEDYEIDPLPEEILLITAGVDTQDDRLEASIWGWGRDHECWLIDNVIIHGKPNTPQVWIDLDTILSQTYDTVYGTKLPIAATFVDSGGHFTQNVYAYTKPRQGRRIYSIKGRSSLKITDEPLIKNRPTKVKGGAHLWLITVGVAKNLIMHNLQLTDYGAGYIHLPKSADEEFFAQLTSEKLVETYKAGSRIQKFVKTRARNEALDCLVYAMAAVYMLSPNWDILDSKKNKQAALLGDVKAEDESVIILDKGRTRQKRRNQSSSWMDD